MSYFPFTVVVCLLAFGSVINGYQCNEKPRKFGCFRDYEGRRMMQFKFAKAMRHTDWQGQNWNMFILKLFCECSKEAKKDGHRFFGLQDYKECWTGNLDSGIDIDSRRENNKKCWSQSPSWRECTVTDKRVCVGTSWHMAIYEITSNSVIIPKIEPTIKIKTMVLPNNGGRPPPRIPGQPPRSGGR